MKPVEEAKPEEKQMSPEKQASEAKEASPVKEASPEKEASPDKRDEEEVHEPVEENSEIAEVITLPKKKKNQKVNNMLNGLENFMWVYPQKTFVPNCKFQTEENAINDTCVLAWNIVGSVVLRRALNYTSIDVDFQDKNFHRGFSISDDFQVEMACLNYSGLLVASRG